VENMQNLVDCGFISIKLEGFFCKMSEIRTTLMQHLCINCNANYVFNHCLGLSDVISWLITVVSTQP